MERTRTSEGGKLIFRNATKTDGSRRVISLPAFLVKMLREHLDKVELGPERLVFTGHGGANGRKDGEGGPVRHEVLRSRVFAPAVKRSVPPYKRKLRGHDLRHT